MKQPVRICITCHDVAAGIPVPFPPALIGEIEAVLGAGPDDGGYYKSLGARALKTSVPTELIVALGSGGVFTAVVEIVRAFAGRHHTREVTLECGDTKIAIKTGDTRDIDDLFAEVMAAAERLRSKEKGDSS